MGTKGGSDLHRTTGLLWTGGLLLDEAEYKTPVDFHGDTPSRRRKEREVGFLFRTGTLVKVTLFQGTSTLSN